MKINLLSTLGLAPILSFGCIADYSPKATNLVETTLAFFRVERQYLVPKNMYLLPGNVAQCSGGAGQMLEMLHLGNMEYRTKQIQVKFTPFWCNRKDDLWKSGCCDLDSERKKVLASSNDSLACALIDLGAFWSVVAHLPCD